MERDWSELRRVLRSYLSLKIVSDVHSNLFQTWVLMINADIYHVNDSSPDGLKEVFTCGGLPPLVDGPDPVYLRTYGSLMVSRGWLSED